MFSEQKNTMVITTKNIILFQSDILFVSHDEDDGMWEFLEGITVQEENAAIVSLAEIVAIDPTVNTLYDLPIGWTACRTSRNTEWKRFHN